MITLQFGDAASCIDGGCGRLTRVIIQPDERRTTHLCVDGGRTGIARLVPFDRVSLTGEEIRVACAVDGLAGFEAAVEYSRPTGPHLSARQLRRLPYRRAGGMRFGERAASGALASDRIPPGKADIRAGEPIHASDGALGQIRALTLDPRDGRLTGVRLLDGGIFRRQELDIPIDAIARLRNGVVVDLTRNEIRALPQGRPAVGL